MTVRNCCRPSISWRARTATSRCDTSRADGCGITRSRRSGPTVTAMPDRRNSAIAAGVPAVSTKIRGRGSLNGLKGRQRPEARERPEARKRLDGRQRQEGPEPPDGKENLPQKGAKAGPDRHSVKNSRARIERRSSGIKSHSTRKNETLVSKGDLRIGARRNSGQLLESGVDAGTGRRNGTSRVEGRRFFLVHLLERRRRSRPSSCRRLAVFQTEVSSTTHRSGLRCARVCSGQH